MPLPKSHTSEQKNRKNREYQPLIKQLSLEYPDAVEVFIQQSNNEIASLVSNSSSHFFAKVTRRLNEMNPLIIMLTASLNLGKVMADGCECIAPPAYIELPLKICFSGKPYVGYELLLNNTAVPAFNSIKSSIHQCNIVNF